VTRIALKRRVPWPNFVLLLLAAAVNMATLKAEGGDNHGEASAEVEWLSWKNQHRQRLTVTISPMADRLVPLDYDGSIHLQVSLDRVPDRVADLPRWAVSIMTSEGGLWSLDGKFSALEEAEESAHDIGAQVGRLCDDTETADDGCVPCPASTGCVLTVEVDFCYTVGDRTVQAKVTLTDSNEQPFSLECLEDTDSMPCTNLRDWLDAVGVSSEPGLCPGE
jgi:hypothetical protein